MAEFLIAYKRTHKNEGGYANIKADRGGETYAGISRVHWPGWAGWKIVDQHKPLRHNQYIADDNLSYQVRLFYKRNFWDKIQGDSINDQETANRLYDFGVTSGHSRTVKQIQNALGLKETGIIDKKLIEAINNPNKHLIA